MAWTDPNILYRITHIKKIHIDEIRAAIDGHLFLGGNVHANATTSVAGFMSAADKTLLNNLVVNAGTVLAVAGTAPIVSSGGTNPTISINEATTSVKGAMSAADKTKLDGLPILSYTLPLRATGTTSKVVSIDAATQTAPGALSASDKAKLDNTLSIPIGGIIIFYPPAQQPMSSYFDMGTGLGKTIAQGGLVDMSKFAICNGSNSTPDLRDKFPLGAGNLASGSIGGEASHELTVEELPSHKHSMLGNGSTLLAAPYNRTIERGEGDMRYSVETGYTGSDQPHNNMPPYMALYYIMRIG